MSSDIVVKNTKMDYSKDRSAAENPVKVMDLTLRDGYQSLFATRGRTEDMIPVAEMMEASGPLKHGAGQPLMQCTVF
jgi:oxaloacetate decarboxylase alpha subunit/pyruvate carboxylase subunit B